MSTETMSAVEDARDLLKTLERSATPGECVQMRRVISSIESETEYYELIRREYNAVTDREADLQRRIDQARKALEMSDFNTALRVLNG